MQHEMILLAELKDGGNVAFNYFYEKYRGPLFRKLLKMVRLEIIAEELLQDLFTKAWDKRNLIDPEQSFKAYLYRIAEHIVYDYFRKLTRESKLEEHIARHSIELSNSTEEGIYAKEIQQQIDDAVAGLPPQQKLVFTLCKIEGKSYKEVSELLGISTATINVHITAATKTMKAKLLKRENLVFIIVLASVIRELY